MPQPTFVALLDAANAARTALTTSRADALDRLSKLDLDSRKPSAEERDKILLEIHRSTAVVDMKKDDWWDAYSAALRSRAERDEFWGRCLNWIMIVITLLMTVATGVQAYEAFRQTKMINEQSKALNEQTKALEKQNRILERQPSK